LGVERIVAVGLLTERERDVLGASLKCVYPVSDAAGFEHLLRALDELDPRSDPPTPSPVSGRIRGLFR
jgi:hypothetical protein